MTFEREPTDGEKQTIGPEDVGDVGAVLGDGEDAEAEGATPPSTNPGDEPLGPSGEDTEGTPSRYY